MEAWNQEASSVGTGVTKARSQGDEVKEYADDCELGARRGYAWSLLTNRLCQCFEGPKGDAVSLEISLA